ncbi:MAG: LysR substrate-binding domain-containing protein [Aquisalimonadaceae bacterium]
MNLRSFDLNLLPVFDAILSEGNLTRAAEKLSMSQPAMSNALARLRDAVGDPLFTRTARGMLPTPRARQMAEQVRHSLDLVQNCLRDTRDFDFPSSRRTFSIAVEDYGEVVITPRFMDWLTNVAPHVRARIWPEHNTMALREELKKGTVDLAVDYYRLKMDGFSNTRLMTDELVSMVREDHPVIGDTLSLEQYTTLPHVVLTQKSPMVDRELAKLGLQRTKALEVPHFISMPLIVKSTDFICTLPRQMARLYSEHFRVRMLKAPINFPKIPIYLVWSDTMENDPGHRWLRESLIRFCERL